MNGYVAKRRGRFYAVIYEGLDPVTGRERRRWYPAGTDRAQAERLAERLAAEEQGRADAVRALTFGAYLTAQWLPTKRLQLAASTYRGYERNVRRHILPPLGRIGLRRLRHHHIEALYDHLLRRTWPANSDAFKKLVSSSGLPRIRFHDLRATPTPPCSSKPACPSRSSASASGTPLQASRWPPTNTSSPACRKRQRTRSPRSSRPARFHRLLPGRGLGRRARRVRRPPGREGVSPASSWWRGQDLNLRPSGYEDGRSEAFSLVDDHLLPVTAPRQVPAVTRCSPLFTVGVVHRWHIATRHRLAPRGHRCTVLAACRRAGMEVPWCRDGRQHRRSAATGPASSRPRATRGADGDPRRPLRRRATHDRSVYR
jgi:hypothetical protein